MPPVAQIRSLPLREKGWDEGSRAVGFSGVTSSFIRCLSHTWAGCCAWCFGMPAAAA